MSATSAASAATSAGATQQPKKDEYGSYELSSAVPAKFADGSTSVVLGIDEAGRGPVLGPLVYGAAYWAEAEDAELSKAGFDDSKALKEEQRQHLFRRIQEHPDIGYHLKVISACELSEKMLRKTPYSLNTISHVAALELVRDVQSRGVKVSHVYVDTVGDPCAYQAMLSAELGRDVAVTVAKKADSLYKVVSAASICAKVVRDRELAAWEYPEKGFAGGVDFGSGYPGDQHCREWLLKHFDGLFGFPDICRFSWGTTKELFKERGVRVDWEEEDDDAAAGTAKIDSFLRPKQKPRATPFHAARMELVDAF